MTTDELVVLLASRVEAVDRTRFWHRCGWALVAGIIAALALNFATSRAPDLARYLPLPMFWVREAFCIVLAVVGFFAVARLGRPGVRLGWLRLGVAAPVLAMWVLACVALLAAPPEAQMGMILGNSAVRCALLITLSSVPIFIAYVWILRRFAPTHLRLAGAAAGFASGSLGAFVYSLHCSELATPFIGIWYLLGMLIPMMLGAVLGPRLLRW